MRKKKVTVLTSVHLANDHRVFYKECRTLADAGYEVVLVCPHEKSEVIDGIRIRALPKPKNRIERMSRTVSQLYRAGLNENADIYHLHDPELLPVGLLLRMHGKHVVYDAHEDVPRDIMMKAYIPKLPRWMIAQLAKIAEKGSCTMLDGVVVAHDHMVPNFAFSRRVRSVRNLPLLNTFNGNHPEPKQDGCLRLIYTGSVVALRGITKLVEALALLPASVDCELLLYGPMWPEGYSDELARMPGFARVCYGGVADFKDIPGILKKADVGVAVLQPVQTYREAEPTKLFEYMASGLPVITSDFDLYKGMVEAPGCGICVDPTDPVQIAKAIEYLFSHPEERARMAENGKAASRNYSWEMQGQKLLKLYGEILNENGKARNEGTVRQSGPLPG